MLPASPGHALNGGRNGRRNGRYGVCHNTPWFQTAVGNSYMYSRLIRALVTVVTVPVLLSSYFTTVKTKRLVPCHVFPSSSVFFFSAVCRALSSSPRRFSEWLALVGAAEVANLTPAAIAPLDGDDALLVIDMQKDFGACRPKD